MLPYRTLEEAEAVLGRELSFAEKLWFDYSARKSNYFLFCHNVLFLFVVYSVAPLPCMLMELLRSKKFDKYKLQPKVRNSFAVMLKCYKNVMRMFVLVAGPLQLVSYPTVKWIGIRTSLPLPSAWEICLQLLVYFMVEDFTHYWIHRLLHSKWGFEKIHHIHHEYTAPIGFAAPNAHWLEVLLLGIPTYIGPAMVPGHMITFSLWLALRQAEAIETHSGYDLPWTPTKYIPFYGGAEYHDYHHYIGGQSQSNFASVFTYCDYIYGTDKGYRYHKEHLRKMREKRKSGCEQNGGISGISTEDLKSEYDLPWTPTKYIPFYGGAEYHDYHHYIGGQSQSNFASVFTYCDYIYGTDKGYRYQKEHLRKMREKRKSGCQQNGGISGISTEDLKSE